MSVYEFEGFVPVIHESAFIHPKASVTGNVIIGRDVYVGPGAAIRGDWGGIVIEDGCNVQENCTIHMFPGVTVVLETSAHIGHGAVVHGAHIGRHVLIGMNAVIMDNAVIGRDGDSAAQSRRRQSGAHCQRCLGRNARVEIQRHVALPGAAECNARLMERVRAASRTAARSPDTVRRASHMAGDQG
jgi:carbonic anhydrase/acetyltransferase-like protein (isoleucine patch superfamily)